MIALKKFYQVSLFLLLFIFTTSCFAIGFEFKQTGESIQGIQEGQLVWQYNHRIEEGKPYFHPLASTSGHVFSDLRPEDHPWHRGLWFSWKFIDGVNYWEEDRQTGVSKGKTKIEGISKSVTEDSVVQIRMKIKFFPDDEHDPVVIESRKLEIFPPDSSGKYRISWESEFEATKKDVVLDRTPIIGQENGKNWGGYAGWSLRMNKESLGGVFQNSFCERGGEANGKRANWVKYETLSGDTILFMDHPKNFNYPSNWYIAQNMPYFSPAVIYERPYQLKKGQLLHLQYQVVISPEEIEVDEAEIEWSSWIK